LALAVGLLDRAATSADPRPLWDAAASIVAPVDTTCAEVLSRAVNAADPDSLVVAARVLLDEARVRKEATAG